MVRAAWLPTAAMMLTMHLCWTYPLTGRLGTQFGFHASAGDAAYHTGLLQKCGQNKDLLPGRRCLNRFRQNLRMATTAYIGLDDQLNKARDALAKRMKEASTKNLLPAADSSNSRLNLPSSPGQIVGATENMQRVKTDGNKVVDPNEKEQSGPLQALGYDLNRVPPSSLHVAGSMENTGRKRSPSSSANHANTLPHGPPGDDKEAYVEDDLDRLSRKELQERAKVHGIKANLSSDQIKAKLRAKARMSEDAKKLREDFFDAQAKKITSERIHSPPSPSGTQYGSSQQPLLNERRLASNRATLQDAGRISPFERDGFAAERNSHPEQFDANSNGRVVGGRRQEPSSPPQQDWNGHTYVDIQRRDIAGDPSWLSTDFSGQQKMGAGMTEQPEADRQKLMAASIAEIVQDLQAVVKQQQQDKFHDTVLRCVF
jgi:hypothetical protein